MFIASSFACTSPMRVAFSLHTKAPFMLYTLNVLSPACRRTLPAMDVVPPQTCTIPARNDSIFKCDNGMIYFKKMAYATTKSFALVGDTIEQCAPTAATNGEACPSAKEYFTNQAENAEASTNYPNKYTLADNTTLNCKDAYETKLDTVNANGAKYDHWINEHKQKCDDGNEYTTDELTDLVSKQNSAKPD